ncbi:Purine ribonucleoside efflux pump nepI [Kluyvera cryocrescens]|uniref:Purine ribonucleoside efflux pump nepI n=1 Tax=Kluyvera cryocrescens TaxID=580 RepID=A0A485D2E3_KLUCR|nr:Purine ribonucleoside efflux pump nepI [Kluyvera cryocrescens]
MRWQPSWRLRWEVILGPRWAGVGAFLCLVPLALIAFIWQCISLPSMRSHSLDRGQGAVFRLLRLPSVRSGMLACGLFFMGQFALFTYVRPFLESVTRVNASGLSLVLLTIGVAGFIGTLLVSTLLGARFNLTLMAIPLLMAVIALGLIITGHHVWVVTLLLGLWGMLATAAPTGWWTWLARTLPDNAEAGGGADGGDYPAGYRRWLNGWRFCV